MKMLKTGVINKRAVGKEWVSNLWHEDGWLQARNWYDNALLVKMLQSLTDQSMDAGIVAGHAIIIEMNMIIAWKIAGELPLSPHRRQGVQQRSVDLLDIKQSRLLSQQLSHIHTRHSSVSHRSVPRAPRSLEQESCHWVHTTLIALEGKVCDSEVLISWTSNSLVCWVNSWVTYTQDTQVSHIGASPEHHVHWTNCRHLHNQNSLELCKLRTEPQNTVNPKVKCMEWTIRSGHKQTYLRWTRAFSWNFLLLISLQFVLVNIALSLLYSVKGSC